MASPKKQVDLSVARQYTESRAMQTILVVEDEAPLREAFEFLLNAEGYSVCVADNGKDGLTMLAKKKPDLILLDMLMPIMNGLEFLQHAKLPTKYPNTRTIVLSNLSDSVTLDDAHKYGVQEVLIKANLSPIDLANIVKKHLTATTTHK
jgi:CheY-like chemotaxis protein